MPALCGVAGLRTLSFTSSKGGTDIAEASGGAEGSCISMTIGCEDIPCAPPGEAATLLPGSCPPSSSLESDPPSLRCRI